MSQVEKKNIKQRKKTMRVWIIVMLSIFAIGVIISLIVLFLLHQRLETTISEKVGPQGPMGLQGEIGFDGLRGPQGFQGLP